MIAIPHFYGLVGRLIFTCCQAKILIKDQFLIVLHARVKGTKFFFLLVTQNLKRFPRSDTRLLLVRYNIQGGSLVRGILIFLLYLFLYLQSHPFLKRQQI